MSRILTQTDPAAHLNSALKRTSSCANVDRSRSSQVESAGLWDRVRAVPTAVKRRLVVAVVLLTAVTAIALGADISTVAAAIALPTAAAKLADLTSGRTAPGRRRPTTRTTRTR